MARNSYLSIKPQFVSFILPTFNERGNINFLISKIIESFKEHKIEIIVVDDNSNDGTPELVKELAQNDNRIRLILRYGRSGLSSAIKEGLISSSGNIACVIDTDGQVKIEDLRKAFDNLINKNLDIVIGSRFLKHSKRTGLSEKRTIGSSIANSLCRKSLPKAYRHITDYQSICMSINLSKSLSYIYKVDVNGFKFFYELLSISKGNLKVDDIPLDFLPREDGQSKLDLSIVWEFITQLIHSYSLKLVPKRAISFALASSIGSLIQILTTQILMNLFNLSFETSIYISVYFAATSNYIINNSLTFRNNRLSGKNLIKGLFKFMLVISLPLFANIGLATVVYSKLNSNPIVAQLSGIIVVFVWHYAASSRFVWNTPQ